MTFLAPLTALLAAAVALPALLLLYLLKLRRRPIRVSSTMLWEQAAHDLQVNTPFRWIRPSWLLLLHLLILLLLLAALARPAIETAAPDADRIFLLIDRSASMRATDGPEGATRLDAAKNRATALLADLAGAARVPRITPIAFAAAPEILAPPTDRPDRLIPVIEGIAPTDQPGDLPRALDLVRSLNLAPADESADGPAEAIVLLVGDHMPEDVTLPAGLSLRFEPAVEPAGDPDNLGITAFSATRDHERPGLLRVFVRVQNTAPRALATALELFLDDARLLTEPVTVPAAEEGAPAETARALAVEAAQGGLLRARLRRPDALATDNTAFALLEPPRSPAVLIAGPAGENAGPDPFLVDVLTELVGGRVRAVDAETLARFSQEDLERFDLLVTDRVAAEVRLPTLRFAPPAPADAPAALDPRGRSSFVSWSRTHPAMAYVTLDSIVFSRRTPPPAGEDGDPPAGVEPLAEGPDGPVIWADTRGGRREIVVAFPLAASNWPVHFSFPIFLANAVEYVAGSAGRVARAVTTTDPVSVRPSPGAEEVRAAGPMERAIPVRSMDADREAATRPAATRSVEIGVLPLAGVYDISGAEETPVVAVNLLDAGESAVPVSGRRTIASPAAADRRSDPSANALREIWDWFAAAALALLALEWLVYTLRSRA